MINFKPSDVRLDCMFIGTFDRAECENTIAVMVKNLALHDDTWRIMKCAELAQTFEDITKEPGHWRTWFNNPFMRVDMHDLVARGFAVWEGDDSIQFTELALERMRKWVTL